MLRMSVKAGFAGIGGQAGVEHQLCVPAITMNGDSYRLKQSAGRRRAAVSAERAEQNQATTEAVDAETGEITET